jgi:hypothetical protein
MIYKRKRRDGVFRRIERQRRFEAICTVQEFAGVFFETMWREKCSAVRRRSAKSTVPPHHSQRS